MSGDLIRAKFKAAGIHLAISAVVFFGILYLILVVWYPEPFFTAQGGWHGIRLMAVVDLVLGPALTLIVFNHLKSKKEILLDLSIIAFVQVFALMWGGYQVYSQRPIALVFWNGAFYTVAQGDYLSQGLENPDFSQYSDHIPPLIYSRALKNQLEVEAFQVLTEKSIPIYAHVSLYESIKENLDNIFQHEVNIEEIKSQNEQMKFRLEEIVHGNDADYKYIALKAKYQNMVLVIDKNGELVGEVKAPYFQ